MRITARRLAAAGHLGPHSEVAGDSGMASAADSEMGSAVDLVSTEGSGSTEDSGLVAVLDSASFRDSVLVSIRSFSAVALVSVGDGIRGGDGATRTIRIRTGEVMAGMAVMAGTTILRRTVPT